MPRISQLPALTVPEANDEIAIVDASAATTKKITRADLLKGADLPNDTVTTAAIADGAVTSDKIDFGGSGSGIWWEEIGRTTLSSPGTSISVASLPARKHLAFRLYVPSPASATTVIVRFNNDSGSNYAWTDGNSTTSQTSIRLLNNTSAQSYWEGFIINNSGNEKLLRANGSRHVAGAAGAAIIDDVSGKWANTSVAINRMDVITTANIGIGGELVILGHN